MAPYKFYIGTKVFFGRNIIREHKSELSRYGKKAMIVTGKASARSCGALKDIEEALKELTLEYMVYDRVENNPSLENVSEGGKAARDFGADLIIGIGGGSPLDAAKAVAVLAVNTMDPVELYKNTFHNKPLPVIAIPTTAGTGSEVTPYSILTRKDVQMKMSFGNEETFPKLAFLDPLYTERLPRNVTVDTAVDAFSHAVEGYLSRRSMPLSDVLAVEAIKIFGRYLKPLLENSIDIDIREKLLFMSMLSGIVISHTGTTIVHGMGYALTYFKNIPHGRANGLLMEEYFKFNYENAKGKIDNIIHALGLRSISEFGEKMNLLLKERVILTDAEMSIYASMTMKQRSTLNNPRSVEEKDVVGIFKHDNHIKGTSEHSSI
jgi:alcohol dehydrogenase class IV